MMSVREPPDLFRIKIRENSVRSLVSLNAGSDSENPSDRNHSDYFTGSSGNKSSSGSASGSTPSIHIEEEEDILNPEVMAHMNPGFEATEEDGGDRTPDDDPPPIPPKDYDQDNEEEGKEKNDEQCQPHFLADGAGLGPSETDTDPPIQVEEIIYEHVDDMTLAPETPPPKQNHVAFVGIDEPSDGKPTGEKEPLLDEGGFTPT